VVVAAVVTRLPAPCKVTESIVTFVAEIVVAEVLNCAIPPVNDTPSPLIPVPPAKVCVPPLKLGPWLEKVSAPAWAPPPLRNREPAPTSTSMADPEILLNIGVIVVSIVDAANLVTVPSLLKIPVPRIAAVLVVVEILKAP